LSRPSQKNDCFENNQVSKRWKRGIDAKENDKKKEKQQNEEDKERGKLKKRSRLQIKVCQ